MKTINLLILLLSLFLFVNYENYLKEDKKQLYLKIDNLNKKIDQEKDFNKRYKDTTKFSGADEIKKLESQMIDGKKYNYSEAMGQVQNKITQSANKICEIDRINWAQTIASDTWYETLRMDVRLKCEEENIQKFFLALKEKLGLYYIDNINIIANQNQNVLRVNFHLVSYREKNEK